jgi:hypothetical protein
MRRTIPDGVCACCGAVGPVAHTTVTPPLDFGVDTMPPAECDSSLPDLCDTCNYAQQRWDAWQAEVARPGTGYPYLDPPPKSPPVRR